MDFRASVKAILDFEKPHEICQFEWGYWPETIARWHREGLPRDKEPWEVVGITYYHRAPVQTRLFPAFDQAVLSEHDRTMIIRDNDGIVKEVSRDHSALPRHIEHPVRNMQDFRKLTERLDPDSPGRFPGKWREAASGLATRNNILVMGGTEISFFGWHRDLMGVENLLMAYYDQPELVHAISEHHVNFLKRFYSKLMEEVEFDFIFMWEDMSYKNGPLISPRLVREFMLPYYRELIGFFRRRRDYKVLLDSDGDVRQLIPLFLEAGVDGLLPFECAAGMDIREIRKEFPELIIAGGIDKREIARGREHIDRELESKLPFMFQQGGYLPSLDHHVPPDVSFQDFRYYLERTRELYRDCR